jgi:hypothetical protein
MLHDARMAALAKPHRGDGYLDGRRLWAESASWIEQGERLESPAVLSLDWGQINVRFPTDL